METLAGREGAMTVTLDRPPEYSRGPAPYSPRQASIYWPSADAAQLRAFPFRRALEIVGLGLVTLALAFAVLVFAAYFQLSQAGIIQANDAEAMQSCSESCPR